MPLHIIILSITSQNSIRNTEVDLSQLSLKFIRVPFLYSEEIIAAWIEQDNENKWWRWTLIQKKAKKGERESGKWMMMKERERAKTTQVRVSGSGEFVRQTLHCNHPPRSLFPSIFNHNQTLTLVSQQHLTVISSLTLKHSTQQIFCQLSFFKQKCHLTHLTVSGSQMWRLFYFL